MGCSGSKVGLVEKDVQYLVNNTHFDQNSIRQSYSLFLKECRDGKLKKVYMQKIYKELYPKGDSDDFCAFVFNTLDHNKKGYLTFKEFLIGVNQMESDLKTQLRLMFQIYDLDRNKKVNKNEMIKVIMSVDKLKGLSKNESLNSAEFKTKKVFDLLGKDITNKNTHLTEDEFILACLNHEFIYNTLLPINK